ncbi:MAG: Abi family protein [Culicoidibacterales bacterium]
MSGEKYVTIENRLKMLAHAHLKLDDLEEHSDKLRTIGYYRVSQIIKRIHHVEPKRIVTLAQVIDIFNGEQKLRGILSELISYFEITMRSHISEAYLQWFGRNGYKDEKNFPNKQLYPILMRKITKQVDMKSLYEVIDYKKYTDIEQLPIWIAIEMSTFHMLTLFVEVLPGDKQAFLAEKFNLDRETFISWINYILVVRNACAHQGLLFSRKFERDVILAPGTSPDVFAALNMLKVLLGDTQFSEVERIFKQSGDIAELMNFMNYYRS